MLLLTAFPFLKTLGWALLDSVWQFAFVWLLYIGIVSLFKNISSAAKHRIAIYLLGGGTIWFFISLINKYTGAPADNFAPAAVTVDNTYYYTIYTVSRNYLDTCAPWLSGIYLAGITFLFTKFFLYLRRADDVRNNGISKLPVEWRMYVRDIAAQLGIKKQITAVISSRIDTPQIIGVLKPMILVPVACLNHMSAEQMEAVLLHELVHIKRNDYFVNIFVASAEILFFFNPFVKQLVINIRREREYSCDDMVLQFQYQPHQYAGALLTLEQNRKALLPVGIAASGNHQKQLLARISRIVGVKGKETKQHGTGAYLLSILFIGCVALINPVKVAVQQISNKPAVAVLYTPTVGKPANENNVQVYKTGKPAVINDAKDKMSIAALEKFLAEKKEALASEDNPAIMEVVESSGNEDAAAPAVSSTTIDFSLPESSVNATPPDESNLQLPYVPSSSYSYQFYTDTSRPKVKGETYQEKLARLSYLHAKQAIDQIDWDKLATALKHNKAAIAAIKKQMAEELAKLNWQKINNDVRDELKQEQDLKMQKALYQQQVFELYKKTEAYNEAMSKQLMEKEQFLKETEKRTRELQKSLEEKDRKLQEEMKKKRIIYI